MIVKLDRNKHSEMRSLTAQMLGANKAFLCAQKQKGDSPPSLLLIAYIAPKRHTSYIPTTEMDPQANRSNQQSLFWQVWISLLYQISACNNKSYNDWVYFDGLFLAFTTGYSVQSILCNLLRYNKHHKFSFAGNLFLCIRRSAYVFV